MFVQQIFLFNTIVLDFELQSLTIYNVFSKIKTYKNNLPSTVGAGRGGSLPTTVQMLLNLIYLIKVTYKYVKLSIASSKFHALKMNF